MSCCRRSRVVDVEVAGQGDVAVVDGVVVVDDETAHSNQPLISWPNAWEGGRPGI